MGYFGNITFKMDLYDNKLLNGTHGIECMIKRVKLVQENSQDCIVLLSAAYNVDIVQIHIINHVYNGYILQEIVESNPHDPGI